MYTLASLLSGNRVRGERYAKIRMLIAGGVGGYGRVRAQRRTSRHLPQQPDGRTVACRNRQAAVRWYARSSRPNRRTREEHAEAEGYRKGSGSSFRARRSVKRSVWRRTRRVTCSCSAAQVTMVTVKGQRGFDALLSSIRTRSSSSSGVEQLRSRLRRTDTVDKIQRLDDGTKART